MEGVLDCRSISAVSEDLFDLTALNLGHFLKGPPIQSLPEPSSQNLALIKRWLKFKTLHRQFALRWKKVTLKLSISVISRKVKRKI